MGKHKPIKMKWRPGEVSIRYGYVIGPDGVRHSITKDAQGNTINVRPRALPPPSEVHMTEIKKANQVLKKNRDVREVQDMARKHCAAAIKTLADIINSPSALESTKISAATALLERGYGKPPQTNINANVNADGPTSNVDEAELNRRIKATLERVESLTKRTRPKIIDQEEPSQVRKLH